MGIWWHGLLARVCALPEFVIPPKKGTAGRRMSLRGALRLRCASLRTGSATKQSLSEKGAPQTHDHSGESWNPGTEEWIPGRGLRPCPE